MHEEHDCEGLEGDEELRHGDPDGHHFPCCGGSLGYRTGVHVAVENRAVTDVAVLSEKSA